METWLIDTRVIKKFKPTRGHVNTVALELVDLLPDLAKKLSDWYLDTQRDVRVTRDLVIYDSIFSKAYPICFSSWDNNRGINFVSVVFRYISEKPFPTVSMDKKEFYVPLEPERPKNDEIPVGWRLPELKEIA